MRRGVFWRDMGVVNMRSRPADHGAHRRRAGPAGGDHAAGHDGAVIHLSLTDDHPYAQAFVIIEAVPKV